MSDCGLGSTMAAYCAAAPAFDVKMTLKREDKKGAEVVIASRPQWIGCWKMLWIVQWHCSIGARSRGVEDERMRMAWFSRNLEALGTVTLVIGVEIWIRGHGQGLDWRASA